MVAKFATTQWSVVLKARDGPSREGREALASLCEAYWYPIYAYCQERGCTAEEAQDFTQAYFTCLLEKDYLSQVRPEAGRFRSFLLASLKHFLSNEWDKEKTLKRGGHLSKISLDEAGAKARYDLEPKHDLTPEAVFERRWAQTLADRALDRLGREWKERGKEEQFEILRGFLTESRPDEPYSEIGAKLGLSRGAVRVAVHRLRRRYGKLMREEISETVADSSQVERELHYVLEILAN